MRTTLDKRLVIAVSKAFDKERAEGRGLIIDTILYELSHCHSWQDMSVRTMRNLYLFGRVDNRMNVDTHTMYWGDTRLFTPEDDLI
jgi:hypothetical protein